ncbi:hypothetical protein EYC80_004989 [Monilinia laxa]|uniref:Alpha/beta hydrolase fold-3 domain-containing protein n=1 Tax=Monilinia laxa TaxID=61186 RepID=A0A5N6KIJ0_MONLA|nr:hypothetical protein EYC80_004989 [Monilinia laxa]
MNTPLSEGYKPEWLELEKALGARPILTGSPAEIELQFNTLIASVTAQAGPPDSSVQTRETSADGIPVRIYTPENPSGQKLPLGLYYHGGGYCVGTLDAEDSWCRYISKHTPCILVSVDYRLGPKHKLPVMLDDSVKAFEWAWQHAPEFGADNTHVFTIGASAGGGLALTVANHLVAAGKRDRIQGVIAMVPIAAHPLSVPAGYKAHYKSYDENASDVPIIDRSTMDTFFAAVDADVNDPGTFVTLSPHLDKFPPTYICTCSRDPLRDDGTVLELLLKEKGVKTKSDFYDGLPHYFWLFPRFKGREEFLANACEGVKFVLDWVKILILSLPPTQRMKWMRINKPRNLCEFIHRLDICFFSETKGMPQRQHPYTCDRYAYATL